MLNVLYPDIDWSTIRVAGFDLDGTLYDEFDFIIQAYRPVAARLAASLQVQEDQVHRQLTERWLEMGSSYPHLFAEVIQARGLEPEAASRLEHDCVRIFRDVDPVLSLPPRVAFLLDWMAQRYSLFLLTDGRPELQRRKISRLGLNRWFPETSVIITGGLIPPRSKPSPEIAASLPLGLMAGALSGVVYFGDRDVDEQWARASGCGFVKVRQMMPVASSRQPVAK